MDDELALYAGWVKLDLLSQGIEVDDSVFDNLRRHPGIAFRKNFYNTPVWFDSRQLPQELRVLGLLIGLNSYGASSWRLSCSAGDGDLTLLNEDAGIQCYPQLISDLAALEPGSPSRAIANLYGGAALAFFSPRTCYFFSDGTECTFCSLAGTAENTKEFKAFLSESDLAQAVRLSLETDANRIEQVMIVGGNMRDLDRGFQHHVSLAMAAAEQIAAAKLSTSISIHIATMPPRDLKLLDTLSAFENIHVMFNLEVWDEKLFGAICPGKDKDYGRSGILAALERLREVIGPYRAHSLLVTGLESPRSTAQGARALAELGVSPIINVYHSDRYSRLGMGTRPTFRDLAAVATELQSLYAEFPIKPYWRNCGRNSIDAEAQRGLFLKPIPEFLKNATA
jgi:hypothetical protein